MRLGRPTLGVGLLLLATTCCQSRACSPPPPPTPAWQLARGPDGIEYRMVERGPYRAYYDGDGQLRIVEYDSNGDGKPDFITHHRGTRNPDRIEIDTNLDGHLDRWEYYDASGALVKVGAATRGDRPDRWTFLGPDGFPSRVEYDQDGDGKPERIEYFDKGRLVRVEVDGDRDGRVDRWQDWSPGLLAHEDLDTDGDGKPDRRLFYDAGGRVTRIEPYPGR
jgi:hypothetical protein